MVYYHAPFLPIDMVSLISYIYCTKGRMIGGCMDFFWHKHWFFEHYVEVR